MRLTRTLLAVFAVGALSVSLAACGGDDDLGANPSSEDLAEAIEDASNGQVSADEIQDEIDDATGGEGLSDACVGASLAGAALVGAMSGEIDPEAEAYLEDARNKVPDEIKDDFAVVADTIGQYAELIKDHDGDITAAMSDPEVIEQMEALSSPEYEEASANVDAWFSANCDTADSN